MTLPYNNIRSRPKLKDLLDQLKRDIFLTMNCHAVATVQSVNFQEGTLTAVMNYTKTVTTSQGVQSPQTYNVLADMPVFALCGGSTVLTFPIKASTPGTTNGDQVLVLFNDRDLDNWLDGARGGELNTPRLHSFSDGIALVGLNDITGWDAIRALLTNGNVALGINPSTNLVRIANSAEGTLNTLLQNLITAIKAITVTTVTSSSSGTWTSGTPNNASALTTAATALAGLLE